MATSIDDELSQIGKALAAAGDGEPVELTDEQREVLARATIPDTFDAILSHKPLGGIPYPARLSDKWAGELRAAFAEYAPLRKLIAELDGPGATNLSRAIATISQDDRLTANEREQIVDDLREHEDRDRKRKKQALATSRVASREAASNTVYLASVSVQGFRGVGQRSVLSLNPGPGLTLVYGANGSGKSSFVEALDVLLTGTTARFDQRGSEWQSAWFNIHSPGAGLVEGVFAGAQPGDGTPLRRSWTSSRLFSSTHRNPEYDHNPNKQIRRLGWTEALTNSKPILGYGELGPLFEEEQDSARRRDETTLARHVRLRAGVGDSLTSALAFYTSTASRLGGRIGELVGAWSGYTNTFRGRDSSLGDWLSDLFSDHRKVAGTPVSPLQLPWRELALAITQRGDSAFSLSESVALKHLFDIAQAYLSSMAPETRQAIKDAYVVQYKLRTGHESYSGFSEEYSARVALYCQSLVEAIHQSRLDQFSRSVEANWSTIRGKDSTVRFNNLTLREPEERRGLDRPMRRVLLDLSVDGVSVERGVLSQGELHSLALSIFLPTMMRPESPFGFAVIDDPTQGMDENAIRGFAKVLRTAAKDLQVIVFTHDGRVLDALRSLDIKHTQINVRRSGQSIVECEVVRDEVLQALEDARLEVEESEGEDETARWRNVGSFCRLAVERACIRAVERRMRRQGRGQSEIDARLRRVVYSQRTTTRKLMSLAIWETTTKWQDLADHLWDKPKWGPHIEQAVYYLNGLNHRDSNKTQWAREEYNDDLYRLIAATRDVVKAVEKNCG